MQDFKDLIYNKRVIFAGPSRLLEGSNKGHWIDHFDTVVRTNGMFPVQEKYQKDYGKKCDALYINAQYARTRNPLPMEEFKANKLKWVCYKTAVPTKDLNNKYRGFFQCRSFSSSIAELHKTVKGLLSGSAIIHDILQFEPTELWVTGIDFYMMHESQWNWDSHYVDNYLPEKIVKEATELKKQGKLVPHDVHSNMLYMISQYKAGKIKFDDDILKLLGLYRSYA